MRLADVDLQHGVRMFVAPAPIGLLIVLMEFGKIAILAMVLLGIHTVGLVFMFVPFMIVIVLFVMIGADLGG